MSLRFMAIRTDAVRALQSGGLDSNGQQPERKVSDGSGVPCRHCLKQVPAGRPYLVLGHRPFDRVQPYAELGPVFLCADACESGDCVDVLPPFLASAQYIVRGYGADERIVYGTGAVTPTDEITSYCGKLLQRENVAFAHIRSASNNCFHVRVEVAPDQ